MRQVPALDLPPIGIVGDGRVARHFSHYFTQLGLPFRTWSRRECATSPPETLASCRRILVLIRDDAIVPFIREWPELEGRRLIHFSGSLVTPSAEGAHPLMTFGQTLYELQDYCAIPFVLNQGSAPLSDLLPGLPNPSFAIPAAERPFYHALCVMAGNFSSVLWLKLFDEFDRRLGIPPAAAHPYLARVTANLMTNPAGTLTGPLSRGDGQVVQSNLRALEGDVFHDVYAAFARTYDQRS